MRWIKNILQIIGMLAFILACIYFLLEKDTLMIYIGIGGLILFVLSFFIVADKITDKEKARGIIWKERKRNKLGLPYTFTLYLLDKDRLFIKRGLFTTHEDEIKLFRIVDVSLKRSLYQKILGLGTIHFDSSDSAMKAFEILNTKKSKEVKDMLSTMIDESRLRNRVISTESVNTDIHEFEDLDDNGIPDRFE